jgi:hypothetical protein
MDEVSGRCFCGSIQYVVDATDAHASVCHCPGCRRSAGAPAVTWITVKVERFRVTRGTLATVRAPEQMPNCCDTRGGTRGFCAACGTPITFVGDDRTHEVDITTGSLDEPARFPPTDDCFDEHRLPWMKRLS